MPRYEANGFYLDKKNLEGLGNVNDLNDLKNLTNLNNLKNATPEEVYDMKNKLKDKLQNIITKLDNIDEENTYRIAQKISVILSNIESIVLDKNVVTTLKLIDEVSAELLMLLS